jgi:SAM-dependent methyltransferase
MTEALKAHPNAEVPKPLRQRLRAALRRAYYFGSKYKCPFCRSHVRTFLPFGFRFPVLTEKHVVGGGYRPDALCPICSSVDRERLLYLFMRNNTDLFETPKKFLHVAPEARVAKILKRSANLDYLTADISGMDVMVRMDITDIQFPDASFDVIVCNHVLEHIVDDRKAMSELHRTLRPDGWGILQVPISLSLTETFEDFSITDPADRARAFGQEDHVRIYARDYSDRLAKVGFNVAVFRWISEPQKFGGQRNIFGLNREEAVYFVSK